MFVQHEKSASSMFLPTLSMHFMETLFPCDLYNTNSFGVYGHKYTAFVINVDLLGVYTACLSCVWRAYCVVCLLCVSYGSRAYCTCGNSIIVCLSFVFSVYSVTLVALPRIWGVLCVVCTTCLVCHVSCGCTLWHCHIVCLPFVFCRDVPCSTSYCVSVIYFFSVQYVWH